MDKRGGEIRRCFGRNAAFPVVLVSTRTNIITVAMAHYFTFEPAVIGVGIRPATHSFSLIRAEQAFVINVLTREQAHLAEACGSMSGRDTDKFARLGLTSVPASKIDSSLIAECPVNIECRLLREIPFDERTWFLGQVVAVHEAPGYDSTQCLIYTNFAYHAVGVKLGERTN